MSLTELRQKEYDLRLECNRLQREVYEEGDPAKADAWLSEWIAKQQELYDVEQARAKAQNETRDQGVILQQNTASQAPGPVMRGVVRGAETTGLASTVELRMAQTPISIYHLFDRIAHPLVYCKVANVSTQKRRVRVTSYIEGYSAHAIDTEEIDAKKEMEFYQLPTLFPDRIQSIGELTRATLNILVEDLDGKVETNKTEPIWLLSRNSVALAVQDPVSGQWNDLSRYLGAFVTPNSPSMMEFQRTVAKRHPQGRLVGYQGPVEPQAQAIFEALKQDAGVTYVNSLLAFSPDQTAQTQRVRLPRESLKDGTANCIDGTLLFASLLEGISINPAIVIVPGHALVGWQTSQDKDEWQYVETTMINTNSFKEALDAGNRRAALNKKQWEATKNPQWFRQWSLRTLRTEHGITPLE